MKIVWQYIYISIKCNLQLQESGSASAESVLTCQNLKGDLQAVFNVLPKDMHQLLLLNPKGAALLQGTHQFKLGLCFPLRPDNKSPGPDNKSPG